jgi:hypothetical protein
LLGILNFELEKRKLDKITIEEWGFANMRIMQELLKQNILAIVNAYINYTADLSDDRYLHQVFHVLLWHH